MKLSTAQLDQIVRLDYMSLPAFNLARVIGIDSLGVTFRRPYVLSTTSQSEVGGEDIYFAFADTRFNGETPESDAHITLLSSE